jgi:type V secretory pathway adhesin AidA
MTVRDENSGQATTAGPDEVENFRGVRIGRALASGAVINHRGIHIGQVIASGDVINHEGVRIGRITPGRYDA